MQIGYNVVRLFLRKDIDIMTKKIIGTSAIIIAICILFGTAAFGSQATAADIPQDETAAAFNVEHAESAFFYPAMDVEHAESAFFYPAMDVEASMEQYTYGKTAMASEDSVSVFFNIVEKPQDIESLMAEQAESQQADVPYFPQSALLIGEELAEVIRDMSEEQVLAKFLDHEGGDLFERTLVAEIVCDLKKTWELDSIHEVFTTRRYFAISRDFWNSIENPSESSQQIAHMVLQSANSQEQYLSEYEAYYYAIDMEHVPELMQQLIGEKEHFITTNYIFVRR